MVGRLPELGELHHIGIAVPGDLQEPTERNLVRLFDGAVVEGGEDEGLDARWTWVRAASGLLLEVVSPRSDADTALNRWLARRAGGLHHVSFDAEDIAACRSGARARGFDLIGENDDHAGYAEFFVDPGQTGGALLHWMRPLDS